MNKKKIVILGVIVVIFAIIGCFTLYFGIFQFTSERWLNEPDLRYLMIDDLQREYSMKEKTQQEVISILGEPDDTWEYDFEKGHYVYFIYYIGPTESMYSIMHEQDMYLVAFCNGIVVNTSVQPT